MDQTSNNSDELHFSPDEVNRTEEKKEYEPTYAQPEPEEDDALPGCPSWMVTFGDAVSLLLTFFVLILSFSNISPQTKTDFITFKTGLDPGVFVGGTPESSVIEVSDEMGAKAGEGESVDAVDDELIIEEIEAEALQLEDNNQNTLKRSFNKVNDFISDKKDKKESVNVEGGGKKGSYQILFDQNFVFTVGRALIQPGGQVYLDKIGALIFELPNDIVVTGFANDFNKIAYPIYPSNIHLSIARANTIAQYFISVWKIDPERIGIQVEPLLQVGEEMDNVTHTTKTKVKINVVSEFHGHVRRQLKKHERERI